MGIFQPAIAMSPEVVANLKMGQTFAPKKERKYIVSQATKFFQIRNCESFRVRVLMSFPIPKLCSPLPSKMTTSWSWIWASDSSCSAWRQHRIWGNKQTQHNKTNQNKTKNKAILLTVVHQKALSLNSLDYLFRRCCCFSCHKLFKPQKLPAFFSGFEVVNSERRDVAVAWAFLEALANFSSSACHVLPGYSTEHLGKTPGFQ